MQVCIAILSEVKVLITVIIAVVQWVVETVCGWVTTVLHFAKEVCEEVCGWLGPFSFLCDWVCKVIEWTEEAVEWVCEEVIVGVLIEFIKIVVEYVFYILTWICWLIDWIVIRWIDLLSCRLGIRDERFIHVCVKVLEADRQNPSWDRAEVERLLRETDRRLRQCNVRLCVMRFEIIETEDHRSGLACGFSSIFTGDHHWFTRNECPTVAGLLPITIYFLEDLSGAKGCSIPGTNYVLVDQEASDATVAHEIGHLCDIWAHSDNPSNVMFSPSTDDSVNFTDNQCCLIRSSKYATRRMPCIDREVIAPVTAVEDDV